MFFRKKMIFEMYNQDEKRLSPTWEDIQNFIQKMIADEEQFIVLSPSHPIQSVHYIQAALYQGCIDVQIGLEKNHKVTLYHSLYEEAECYQAFRDFFEKQVIPPLERFELFK